MRRTGRALACAPLLVLAIAGCGSSESAGEPGTGAGKPLTVFAAASLQPAFDAYAEQFPQAEVDYSFAGSDTLAAQIKQGIKPDVYAAANTTYPEELHQQGLLKKPQVFATNRLVLAVPADSDIDSTGQVAEPGVTVAIGERAVPVGSYTREVLAKLGPEESKAILDNVASEEPDVSGIVGKLTQGAADAGFVYQSDVAASDGKLKAIELAPKVSPDVAYGVGVGADAQDPKLAQAFIDGLTRGAGARALAANDFGPPPASSGG